MASDGVSANPPGGGNQDQSWQCSGKYYRKHLPIPELLERKLFEFSVESMTMTIASRACKNTNRLPRTDVICMLHTVNFHVLEF